MDYVTKTYAARDDADAARYALGELEWMGAEDGSRSRPLAYCIDRTGGAVIEFTTYAAIARRHADGTEAVFAVVIHQHRTATEIGWQIIPESDGPQGDRAPVSILDLLTPTVSTVARAWRAACRKRNLGMPTTPYAPRLAGWDQ